MAYVNGTWLNREERAERIRLITERARKLKALYDRGKAAEYHIEQLLADKRELERLKRIHRAEKDLLYFAWEYFSETRNPGNPGNWEGFDIRSLDEAPEFHHEICAIMDEVSHVNRNAKVAIAAPRGHAKSSYLSKAYPLREVVYRLRRYIINISETPKVATANIKWISDQLKYNKKLREDFGPLLSPKDQANIVDNNEAFIAWLPGEDGQRIQLALVEAASTGQALRGRSWNGQRPDLIILDDLEDARAGGNASTPELRKKLREWFAQTVIPLGDPKNERTAFVYMGTTVHHDSLLMHVLNKRSDFQTKVYRAIISPPKNADLWEKCREIYTDWSNPNRAKDARAFYEANRESMDEGAKVLWPAVQPLYKLMTWKWDNGSKAFNTEYQNNPIDEESMIFNPEKFTYWTDDPKKSVEYFLENEKRFEIGMGVDFAMGKERGDYSALTVVARDRQTDVFYVIFSYGDRTKPTDFIDVIVDKVIEFQPDIISAEAQAAQEFFVDTLKQALAAAGYPAHTRVKKIHQRSRKELRIEALLPDIENGRIQFSRNHALLLEQLERYPHDHDDLPDSLEMAISALKRRKARIVDKPVSYY